MAAFHVSFLALFLAIPIPAHAKLLKNTIDKTELIHERHSYSRNSSFRSAYPDINYQLLKHSVLLASK